MKKTALKLIGILIGIFIGLLFAEIASRIYFSSKDYTSVGRYQALGKTRGITSSIKKEKDIIRIAFSGDSYTYGFGVEEDDTFPEILEKRINDENETKVECLNFGHRGANVSKELKILNKKILSYSPDIIVHGFVMNDFTHPKLQKKNYEFYKNDKIKYRPFRNFEKYSRFLYFLDQTIFTLFGKSGKAQISNLNDLYDPEKNPHFDIMKKSLEDLVKTISSYNGIVAFFPHFIKNESEYDFYKKSIRIVSSLCEKYEVEFIELLPVFSHKPYFKWWIHPHDHHPNKEAHEIIAETLMKRIGKKIGESGIRTPGTR
ncbi:MAG: SGNH/GDSL hydrolase family protein [Candidatus Aminicenantes bacterium]|nr:SGNH/GDSL hydrolase family protein [Candidatus Aminicenantes bacterium]